MKRVPILPPFVRALLLAILAPLPLAAQLPAGTATLEGRLNAFFHEVRKESRPGAAAFFPRRGEWSWVKSTPVRDGVRAGVWRFRAAETLPAMSAGGPLCGTFGGHYGVVETRFGMQVRMHREPWRRVRDTRFVPRGEPDDSPTFVEWRREDGAWVVSAFGDRPYYEHSPRILGEPRGMIVRDLVVTPSPPVYAPETEWFRENRPIIQWSRTYTKHGSPRLIEPALLTRLGLLGRVVIYMEKGQSPKPAVLYAPTDATRYQPYEAGHVSLPCS